MEFPKPSEMALNLLLPVFTLENGIFIIDDDKNKTLIKFEKY